MSKSQSCGCHDFSKYASMPTVELEKVLRLDAEMPKGQALDEKITLSIIEMLAQRKQGSVNLQNTAHKAWESFQAHYLPEEALYPEHPLKTKKHGKTTRSRLPRWNTTIAVIAILVGILPRL